MNAITRVYSHHSVVRSSSAGQQRTTWNWKTRILMGVLIGSAFAVVYLKDLNRREFIRYQEMARANQQAQVDWEKLLLEQSTFAAQANVQKTATQRLHMYRPETKEIVLLAQ